MKLFDVNTSKLPVSSFIAISIIVIYLLFTTNIISEIPCGTSIHNIFMSNFVHIDAAHLISNLYALYAISRVEEKLGFKPFIWLIVFLLAFNTLVEYILRNVIKDMKCSIGFSGILFGLITWELLTTRKLDVQLIIAIVISVITPSIGNKKVSLSGHAVGALSGVVGGIIWKTINTEKI